MAERKRKLSLALDSVPFGTEEQNAEWMKMRRIPLPEGVSSKQMYLDTFRIAWPSLVELTLAQLASMVDMMMVGKLNSSAVAAVGLTTQPIFLLMTLIMALNVGVTALVAQNKGAGKKERAELALRQALMLNFIIGVVMSVIGAIFAEPMVKFMGANEDTLADAASYLRIRMYGFLAFGLTSTITAALRGAGDSRTSMIYNVIANASNVLFNYVLIFGHWGFPRLEVAGAAWATILGQFIAFGIAIFVILKKSDRKYLHLDLKKGFKPDKDTIKNMVQIGIPSMIEQLIMRVGMVIFAKTVASIGTVQYATHTICMNIQALSFMVGQAFAVSGTSLVGQSLGKSRKDMALAYGKRTVIFGVICACVLMVLFFFFGGTIVSWYNDESEVVRLGSIIMSFVAFTQPFQTMQFIQAGALRGAGDTRSTAIVTLITVVFVRAALGLLFVYVFHWGLIGAWVALVLDQLVRTVLIFIRYISRKWMNYARAAR